MPVSTVPKTVLIIDDEPSIVDLLKDILGSANFRPIGVVKWTDAVDAIGHENPSLILLDLKMPTIDGPSLLEFLRKEGVDIPVIIVSGFITEEVAEDLKKLDVEAFVQKPFRAADIIAHVERVIGPAAEPPKVTPTAVDPKSKSTGQVSMTAFLSSAAPGGNPAASNSPPAPSDESDVLAALSKLDKGSPSHPPAAKPAPASANSDTSDILNALQRHDTDTPAQPLPENPATAPPQAPSPPLPQPSANASPAPEEASSAAPPPAQPTRAVTAPPASAPVAPPSRTQWLAHREPMKKKARAGNAVTTIVALRADVDSQDAMCSCSAACSSRVWQSPALWPL